MSVDDLLTPQDGNKRVAHPTIGVVTNTNDPDKQNRVKVRLLHRDTTSYETDFIRVMTPLAGKGMGLFFMPQAGDEVVVAFCDGDIARPFVMGSMWNPQAPAPATIQSGKNETYIIKTKSGNSIVFSDEKGKESLTLTTAKGASVSLNDKDNSITVSCKGRLTLDAQDIELKAKNNISLSGANVKVQTNASIELKGTAKVDVTASGPVNIKGALVKLN